MSDDRRAPIAHPQRRALVLGALLPSVPARPPSLRPVQYSGDQRHDYLALLSQVLRESSGIAAFPVGRPCGACRDPQATVSGLKYEVATPLGAREAEALRAVLLSPESYVWGASIATQFIPSMGFLFAAGAPRAALIVTPPLGGIGQGRLILPQPLRSPSLTFVTLNQSILTIASIYAATVRHPGAKP